MTYKVVKEFINKQGVKVPVGYNLEWKELGKFGKGLLNAGFIEEVKEKYISGQYVPKAGERFWSISYSRIFGVEPDVVDGSYAEGMAEVGLSFETEKECDKFIAKLKAYQIIRKDAKGFEPDWGNTYQVKYSCWYDSVNKHLETSTCASYRELGQIYFRTHEDLMESFNNHRKEWLILLNAEESE